jgi:hypothetical protein
VDARSILPDSSTFAAVPFTVQKSANSLRSKLVIDNQPTNKQPFYLASIELLSRQLNDMRLTSARVLSNKFDYN